MAVTIELQNLGDAQLCRDITEYLEHAFSGRQGEWCVSLPDRVRRKAGTCEWKDLMALNGRILSRLLPVSTSFRPSGRLF
jgi:hypothetical protein